MNILYFCMNYFESNGQKNKRQIWIGENQKNLSEKLKKKLKHKIYWTTNNQGNKQNVRVEEQQELFGNKSATWLMFHFYSEFIFDSRFILEILFLSVGKLNKESLNSESSD